MAKRTISTWKFMRRDEPILIILSLSLVFRLIALFCSGGFLHSDEIFQTVEQAHRISYGYGIVPSEFLGEEYAHLTNKSWGERSFFFPLVLSFFDSLNPFGHSVLWLRFLLSLFSVFIPLLIYKIGLEVYDQEVAFFAGLMASFWWELLYFSSRTLSTPFATPFLLASIYYATRREPNPFLSGIFLGIAFMVRFPTLLVLIPALFYLGKGSVKFLSGLFLVFLLQGLLDLFTWGIFLHSPVEFLRYNFFGEGSYLFGEEPFTFYLVKFAEHWGPLILLALPYLVYAAVFGTREEKFLSDAFLIPLFFFSWVPHKEYRFVFFLVPFLILFFSRALIISLKKSKVRHHRVLALLFVFSLALSLNQNWSPKKDLCSAMEFVGKQDDLKSLLVFDTWSETCGYSYLHKRVPIYFFPAQDEFLPGVNEVANLTYLRRLIREEVNYVICTSEKSGTVLDFEANTGLNVTEICLNETSPYFEEFKRIGSSIILRRR